MEKFPVKFIIEVKHGLTYNYVYNHVHDGRYTT